MQTEQIDFKLPYERRYYPGMVFQLTNGIYEVLEYRIPVRDDLYVSPTNLFANTIIDNSQYRGENYEPAWIVEQIHDLTGYNLHYKNKFSPGQKVTLSNGDTCTVVRYGDPRAYSHAFLSWRVADIDPVALGNLDELDTYIDNGNRWLVTDIQKPRTYENSYKIGQVITDVKNNRWTVVDYRKVETKDRFIMDVSGKPIIDHGYVGVTRWVVEPYYEVKECSYIWDESAKTYKFYGKPAKVRVYDRLSKIGEYGCLNEAIFNVTRPGSTNTDVKYCEFEYDPREDEELIYKEDLRKYSTEQLIENGVGTIFSNTCKRAWFRDVLKERMK